MTEKWINLCNIDEVVEGEPRSFDLPDGRKIAVLRSGEEVFAIDDKCTHGNASLSDGWQEGEIIECPFHGGSFNIRDGNAVNFPCVDPVRTYPVQLSGIVIMIDIS